MLLINVIAILKTRISIRTFAFESSAPDNLEPKICFGKKLNTTPHMAANAANILKRLKNIPFSDASFFLS